MTSPRPRFVAAVVSFFFASALCWAAPVKFDIARQPVASAIKAFIKQSKAQVAYRNDELDGLTANEVKGEFEPEAALGSLLKDTGCSVAKRDSGIFIVTRTEAAKSAGSVRGSLAAEGGKALADVLISIRETGQSTSTDRYGVYTFPNVAAGTYVLVASAPNYQTMNITDVLVRAGRELTLGKEEMRKAAEGVLALEPFVVHADTVTELEKFEVTDTKQKPFSGADVDIPRTIDDTQPYYIFDSKTIDQSGAINVEDFLKQRLTMDTQINANHEIAGNNTAGNTSSINLRGLGADKTLVLVNGRQVAGVTIGGTSSQTGGQPDLNGLPLSAIDRIEVLPTSASGIYGGGAIGGVVNIILKKNYAGGEIRATYGNAWDNDSPARTLGASYGFSLEGGRTHVMVSASYSDSKPMLLQDRLGLIAKYYSIVYNNSPSFVNAATAPFPGALPNIIPSSSSTAVLTLKSSGSINSRNTYVPAGTSPSTSLATLSAGLLANAGLIDADFPATTGQNGLYRPFGVNPKTEFFSASIRRQFLPKLEVFADFSYAQDNSTSVYNSAAFLIVPAASPTNPFTTDIRVNVPDAERFPMDTKSATRSMTVGAIAHLPFEWIGEADYTRSQNLFSWKYDIFDSSAQSTDLASGVLNLLVDTRLYPLNLAKYAAPESFAGSTILNDFAVRGNGPLRSLPWGTPLLTVGLEDRINELPSNSLSLTHPLSPSVDSLQTFFSRKQINESAYLELTVPLVAKDWMPLVHIFELQAAGRVDRYSVDTGTPYVTYTGSSLKPQYGAPTLNGLPYFARTSYTSSNGTAGFRYQPMPALTLRASLGTAFLPPTPDQLLANPVISTSTTPVNDPVTGQSNVPVHTISGGNPNLTPQSSRSNNVGIIWEPRNDLLRGLRLDAEYYEIQQNNAIGTLSVQQMVTLEKVYPGRVVRDATGTITTVDVSSVNLYRRNTSGIDLSADYSIKTGIGTFGLSAAGSVLLALKNQFSLTLPEFNAVGYHPVEGGAPKYKSNTSLTWDIQDWRFGWTARYLSSYKMLGVAGGPDSVQFANGAVYTTTDILAQGSTEVPSEVYHDLFIAYSVPKKRVNYGAGRESEAWRRFASILEGVSVQMGVKDVFNRAPPMDVLYSYYIGPYGDIGLRSYWLSVRKEF